MIGLVIPVRNAKQAIRREDDYEARGTANSRMPNRRFMPMEIAPCMTMVPAAVTAMSPLMVAAMKPMLGVGLGPRMLALDAVMGTVVVVRRHRCRRRSNRGQDTDGQGQDVSHDFSLLSGFPM